ncbi:hypothetical protein RSOLAG22IIIB_12743 [Rhizoctonia solani]|uniref:Crinkler effector protein N-terminal domain-containing protein n=1 Tax=Rhizoctonia solani TaxID=456999 RepID=A0A0K6GGR8_9AGAM|nr:hypothetical protein RSOLAG22IIIB_12743 [Rhizoctonia solani]
MTDFSLNCFVLGDDSYRPFPVKTSQDKDIFNLTRDIKACYAECDTSTIAKLELYRVDISAKKEDLANIQPPPTEDMLELIKLVGDYWTTPEEVQRDRVHILVKANIIPNSALSPAVPLGGKRPRAEEDYNEFIQDFKKARVSYCERAGRLSASVAAKHDNFIQQQRGKDYMLNGRPRKHTGPPIVLYHPVFGDFLSNLQSPEFGPALENEVFKYFSDSQDLYKAEPQSSKVNAGESRDPSTRDALHTFLGKLWKVTEEGAAPDGVFIVEDGYSAVMEMQNEIGTGGSDPSIRAAQSYLRLWKKSKLFDRCCCPTILIAIAGPWMCILGAVFLKRPIVQPLTDYLWVGSNPSKPKEIRFVARVFDCVLQAQKQLKVYYTEIASQDPRSLDPSPFPYPNHFIADEGHQVDFKYLSALEPLSLDASSHLKRSKSQQITLDKLVFLAELRNIEPSTRVVIKFVESYNSEAHGLLAKEGLAPKLLYDGTAHQSRRLGPDHYMIVMEYVNGVDLGRSDDLTLPMCVGQDVERALSILHDADIVFGDLRSPNVMLVKGADDKITGAKLIDFDWCAKHLEGRYPLDLNVNDNVTWADGVRPGELMKKEHDNVMKEYLFVLRELV